MATEITKSTIQQPFYSTMQAAQILKVSRVTVFKWIGKQKLKAYKIGRNYAISAKVLKAFSKSKTYLNRQR